MRAAFNELFRVTGLIAWILIPLSYATAVWRGETWMNQIERTFSAPIFLAAVVIASIGTLVRGYHNRAVVNG